MSETQMVQDPKQAQMVNPPVKEKPVKEIPIACVAPHKGGDKLVTLVTLRGFKIENMVKDSHGVVIEDKGYMTKPGDLVKVTERMAADLTKPLKGAFSFTGERYDTDKDVTYHDLTRARRATKRDLIPNELVDELDQEV